MAQAKTGDAVRRSKRIAATLAVAALVVGGGTAIFVMSYYSKLKERAKLTEAEKQKVDPVVVTSVEIPLGKTITEDMVKIVEFPHGTAPKGTMSEASQAVGRVPKVVIGEGVPLFESMLTSQDGGSGFSALIPENLRAMSVKVNEVIGVAGFLHPGAWVDVLVMLKGGKDIPETRAKIVLQRVRVFGVGEYTETPPDKKKAKAQKVNVVTLLVSPEESERLALASLSGKILLSMRGPLDETVSETTGATQKMLMEGPQTTPSDEPKEIAAAKPIKKASNAPKGARGAKGGGGKGGGGKGGKEEVGEVVEVFHGAKMEERKIRPAANGTEVFRGDKVEERRPRGSDGE